MDSLLNYLKFCNWQCCKCGKVNAPNKTYCMGDTCSHKKCDETCRDVKV